MRTVVVGLGVQGAKRQAIAQHDVVATVDPVRTEADARSIAEVPDDSYDSALLCVPDGAKFELIMHLLGRRKHILVEKPLLLSPSEYDAVRSLRSETGCVLYVAYNHRFEPHIAAMDDLLRSGRIGSPYSVLLSYGNGTAELARLSEWRDQGMGVIPDLASHLLDMVDMWWGLDGRTLSVVDARNFENRSYDYALLRLSGKPTVYLEVSMVSWRNHFRAEIQCSEGSAHIASLCKWGPTSLTVRDRKHPSGRPDEAANTLVQPDPTWQLEYEHFKQLILTGMPGNLEGSVRISELLSAVEREVGSHGN